VRSPVVAALVLATAATLPACGDDTTEARTDATTGDEVELTYAMGGGLSSEEASRLGEILQDRIDALGIEEASVEVGDGEVRVTITQPPGVDTAAVSKVLGATAELRFRPVLLTLPEPEAPEDLAETPAEDDQADAVVVLDDDDAEPPTRYQLGPATVTGTVIESADARLGTDGRWSVALVLTPEGIEEFNELAAECSPPSETCPTGQLAIVLDSTVRLAPTIQQPSFERDQIEISGSFTEEEAKALALVLRYGALPTSLTLTSTSP
jgi:preprotein translocase subunit SecD